MDRNSKRKINVIHLVEELTIGGLEKILTAIVLDLDKKKYDVSVWCLREGGFFADKLVKEGIDVKILHFTSHLLVQKSIKHLQIIQTSYKP